MWKKGRSNIPVVGELFKENGVPSNLIDVVLDEMETFVNNIQTHPTLTFISGGEKIDLGNKILEVIDIPGHSEGHIGFFCEDDGILFSGDQFLPQISTNTGFWPASNPNPLGLFMKSLEKVDGLSVKMVLPAHGSVFYDCPGKLELLMRHYCDGLDLIADLTGAGSTAYQICVKIFGNGDTFSEICFSLTETLAYLAYLESSSRVVSNQEAGIVVYRRF